MRRKYTIFSSYKQAWTKGITREGYSPNNKNSDSEISSFPFNFIHQCFAYVGKIWMIIQYFKKDSASSNYDKSKKEPTVPTVLWAPDQQLIISKENFFLMANLQLSTPPHSSFIILYSSHVEKELKFSILRFAYFIYCFSWLTSGPLVSFFYLSLLCSFLISVCAYARQPIKLAKR